jgi:Tfp pilus assembly protein PilX
MEGTPNRVRDAKGVALILALLVLLILSTLGAGLIFVTQTEIWSSSNYRSMLEARYAAEAGAQRAVNWLSYTYTPPTSSQFSTNFNLTTYPVQCSSGCTSNGSAVVLSAMSSVASNYPIAAQQTSFNSTLNNVALPGVSVNSATYQVSATLLRATSAGAMTWQITSIGNISGLRAGQVQVVTTYETSTTTSPLVQYGLFATGTGCPGAVTTSGNMVVDSYNSGSGPYGGTNILSTGDVGSNGGWTNSATVTIHGNLWLQHPSTGSCPNNDITNSGTMNYNNADTLTSVYTPAAPNPVSTPNTSTVLSSGTTTLSANTLYGNFINSGTATLSFPTAGTYNINSITNSGSLTLQMPSTGQVILNIGGNGQGAITLSGVMITGNTSQIADNLIIYYAGTGGFTVSGSASTAAVVYAPNAAVTLSGTTAWYGAILASTFTDSGGASIHFDTALKTAGGSGSGVGPYRQVGFTWSNN